MTKIINFYNQKGAGPKHIAKNFINELLEHNNSHHLVIVPNIIDYRHYQSTEKIRFIHLPCPKSLLSKVAIRGYIELVLLPYLYFKYKPESILAFGNFLFSPVPCKKVVLMHHPYLVDDKLYGRLAIRPKVAEAMKRIAFFITTKNINTIVVQSSYMRSQLEQKFPNAKFSVREIPNPISSKLNKVTNQLEQDNLFTQRLRSMSEKIEIFYVSRFYPHKNHQFLLNLSCALNAEGLSHQIKVTVDPSIPEASKFLKSIYAPNISIVNLSELEQSKLARYYKESHLFIFPSSAETFGNPLIEAMCYGLPILVPDLEYAHSIVGESGTYYEEDNVSEALLKVRALMSDDELYLKKSKQSIQQFDNFPNSSEWVNLYQSLI